MALDSSFDDDSSVGMVSSQDLGSSSVGTFGEKSNVESLVLSTLESYDTDIHYGWQLVPKV